MMRPEHCFYDIGRDMKFKLTKIKRTHLLHSQPLKTGKINQIHYLFLVYYFCLVLKMIKDVFIV